MIVEAGILGELRRRRAITLSALTSRSPNDLSDMEMRPELFEFPPPPRKAITFATAGSLIAT